MLDTKSQAKVENLLLEITNEGSGSKKHIISNADGKTWIMPHKNMRTAMNLYQPSSAKGKLLKNLFPYLKGVRYVRHKLNVGTVRLELEAELDEILKKTFLLDNLEFAIFGGTPSNHQKITIQLSKGNKIVGYCKISDQKEIIDIFHHEQKILDYLRAKQIEDIPECLYCGSMSNEIGVFIQTTVKTNQSIIPHQWSDQHLSFLADFRHRTRHRIDFEESDFYTTLRELTDNSKHLSVNKAYIVREATKSVFRFYTNKKVYFSAYHGDFTPWNMFIQNGKLFVFDFEYTKLSYPPYLDWFHFFTQSSIFEKHWDANKIYEEFIAKKDILKRHIDYPAFSYKCYLLDIISRFVGRDKGEYNKDVAKCLTIWTNLLTRL